MQTLFNEDQWPELFEGDPLADAVIEDWFKADEKEKNWLVKGIQNGVSSIPKAPESYKIFLQENEATLRDAPSLSQATDAYLFAGQEWLSISTGPGALLHTYTDPHIVETLVHSGKLLGNAAAKRLAETQLWLLKVIKPDSWLIGGAGYVHTLQVRLIHAKVRLSIMRKDKTASKKIIPIDQRQLVRTLLDFSVVSPKALALMGITWTEMEKSNVAALWQLVGKLLGIHPRIMSDLATPGRAEVWLENFDHHMPIPNENARALTQAMLEALGKRMSSMLKLPETEAISLMHAFSRHIHGDDLANAMGVYTSSVASLIPGYVDANRSRIREIRRNMHFKETWISTVTTQIDEYCARLDGSAAYQQD